MSVKSIEISNVMAFQYNDKNHFKMNFTDGINVLIGENGVGKTTVLKMIYTAAQASIQSTDVGNPTNLLHFFSNNITSSDNLKNETPCGNYCFYRISNGEYSFEYSLSHNAFSNLENWVGLDIQSVFIPSTEMLSHSKGFLALNQKYNMPFDRTQVDIIVNASLPETRNVPKAMAGILDKIGKVINGTVIQENDTFYVVKNNGRKIDFSLEAEGLRKLGLLWKLIRNGLLEEGTVLLWDEPEANLNPELYPLVADILLELQKNGVQIFAATHSYNFAKYLEIRRTEKEQVLFHNLYKGTSEIPTEWKKAFPEINNRNDDIYSTSAYKMEDLSPNHIMIADLKLLDEVYEQ